jgi:hypothetical protein
MRKKRKDQSRTQDVTEFDFNNAYISGTLNLQQLRLSRYIKKGFYTFRTWSLTQKWVVKPIGNTSDNTLKTWVTTHSKIMSTTAQERVEHNNSRRSWEDDHEWSNWENREKLDWAWTKIWLIECINILSYISLLNMASKLSGVMILLDGSVYFSERDDPFKIDLLKQLKKLFFGLNRYNGLRIVITV